MILYPYTTRKTTISFYFPEEGKFKHNSTNISINGIVVSKSGESQLQVETTKRVVHIESFDDLLAAGTKD